MMDSSITEGTSFQTLTDATRQKSDISTIVATSSSVAMAMAFVADLSRLPDEITTRQETEMILSATSNLVESTTTVAMAISMAGVQSVSYDDTNTSSRPRVDDMAANNNCLPNHRLLTERPITGDILTPNDTVRTIPLTARKVLPVDTVVMALPTLAKVSDTNESDETGKAASSTSISLAVASSATVAIGCIRIASSSSSSGKSSSSSPDYDVIIGRTEEGTSFETRATKQKFKLSRLSDCYQSLTDLSNSSVAAKLISTVLPKKKKNKYCAACLSGLSSSPSVDLVRRVIIEHQPAVGKQNRRNKKLTNFTAVGLSSNDERNFIGPAESMELRDGRFSARFSITDDLVPGRNFHIWVHEQRLEVFGVGWCRSFCSRCRSKGTQLVPESPPIYCGSISLPIYVDPTTVGVHLERTSESSTSLVVNAMTKGRLEMRRRSVSFDDLLCHSNKL